MLAKTSSAGSPVSPSFASFSQTEAGSQFEPESAENSAASRSDGAADPIELSPEARARAVESTETKAEKEQVTPEESREIADLKRRDQEVRAHERAHMAAGGGHVRGGATFSFEKGPDGKMYAVGGEVSIDMSKEPSPEATLQKAQAVRWAALAPANPSPQDRAVAARASAMEAQARKAIEQEFNRELEQASEEVAEQEEQAAETAGKQSTATVESQSAAAVEKRSVAGMNPSQERPDANPDSPLGPSNPVESPSRKNTVEHYTLIAKKARITGYTKGLSDTPSSSAINAVL